MLHVSIVCSNREYMDRLDHYIRFSEWRERVRLHRYTSIGSLVEAGLHRYELDSHEIVILEDSLQDLEKVDTEHSLLLLLSQQTQIISFTTERRRSAPNGSIYMFQPVSQMMRRILEIATVTSHTMHQDEIVARPGGEDAGKSRMTTIAVTSPYGGSGVTTVSRVLAQQLAMRYAKVLYLNMELYPKQLHIPEIAHDFSRFIYMLTTRPDELSATWTHYCAPLPDKSFAFVPPKIKRNMRDMKPEYINLIGDRFRELGFQAVVIDLDAHWLDDLLEGRIRCDECWIVLPWKHRKLLEFPELLPYLKQPHVKLIANRTDAHDGKITSVETKELEVDALLPYTASARVRQEEGVADDRLTALISRVIRDSAVIGGAADDG